jgi:thiopeptide-type bacteriocin biosynthesis protein
MIKRTFIIGDEWFYCKLYTGKATSDIILIECIRPITSYLLKKRIIDKWFFIRYNDPEYHLRIRCHLHNKNLINKIIFMFNEKLNMYVNNESIWKVQIDTYQREIERYEERFMELSEKLFFIDSELILNLLIHIKNNEELRWLAAFKLIDNLFKLFNCSIEKKLWLISYMSKSFIEEFQFTDNTCRKQLSRKYRDNSQKIKDVIQDRGELNTILTPIYYKYAHYIQQLKTEIQTSKLLEYSELHRQISSYIHMLMNRLFRDQQRVYELVIYDLMWRYYHSTSIKIEKLKSLNN